MNVSKRQQPHRDENTVADPDTPGFLRKMGML